jgi:hypothetical protein
MTEELSSTPPRRIAVRSISYFSISYFLQRRHAAGKPADAVDTGRASAVVAERPSG